MHLHTPAEKTTRLLVTTFILNLLYFFVELFAGLLSGSLALLSDAAHMLSDVLSISVALVAHLFSVNQRKAGKSSRKAELIGASINAISLLGAGVFILAEGIRRFAAGVTPVMGWPVFVVGLIGLLVNGVSFWLLSKGNQKDLNIRSVIAHMWADALGSVGAIVASVFIILGFPVADIIVAGLIALFIFFSAIQILLGVYKHLGSSDETVLSCERGCYCIPREPKV